MFLLRDVARPLSVDSSVWGDLDGPSGRPIDTLPWISIEDVRAHLGARAGAERDRWVLVALGVVAENPSEVARVGRSLSVENDRIARALTIDVTKRASSGGK